VLIILTNLFGLRKVHKNEILKILDLAASFKKDFFEQKFFLTYGCRIISTFYGHFLFTYSKCGNYWFDSPTICDVFHD
jgi:hypothetical protein